MKRALPLALAAGVAFGTAALAGATASAFRDSFDRSAVLVETGAPEESPAPDWWLNSGARLVIANGVARSVQNELPPDDEWRRRYAASSPVDTDGGRRPQNLFRLLTRERWRNLRQEVRLRINRLNPTSSPERGAWSGVLLMQRYLGADDLYYAGLRLDGTAVIKKKRGGRYETLAIVPRLPGASEGRVREDGLPVGRWIRLRSTAIDGPDGAVRLALYVAGERPDDGWTVAAEAVDDGSRGAPIREPGRAGIRADFADVEIDEYEAAEIRTGP